MRRRGIPGARAADRGRIDPRSHRDHRPGTRRGRADDRKAVQRSRRRGAAALAGGGGDRRGPSSVSHGDHQVLPREVGNRKRRSPAVATGDRALRTMAREGAGASEAPRDPPRRRSRDRAVLGKGATRKRRRQRASAERDDVHPASASKWRIAVVERSGAPRAPAQGPRSSTPRIARS